MLVNFFIFVCYFPAILMFWDQKIRNKKWGCAFEKGVKVGKWTLCKRVPEDEQ